MLRGLFTAAAGMQGMSFMVDTIANNLANANTFGYKRTTVDFQDLLYQTIKPAGSSAYQGIELPSGIQIGHGVRVAATRRVFNEGSMRNTENPLDVAILGKKGFFQVTLPDNTTGYTRDGAFSLDQAGNLVTSDGLRMEPNIQIPPDATAINISAEGIVSVVQPGNLISQVGQIQLASFVNPAGLAALGNNLFVETEASGPPITSNPGQDGLGTLEQGFLENSNVSVAEELVNLITAQRAFEVNSRAVRTGDEMIQTAVNLKQ
ncbi:MAG TPA: flagellar basal-body rod protein FlgG [bacterium]|nr:flagellar basal-body rod protein FlgG [Candidatus Omnitrophota bacterium]HOJ60227.1 flagellar basal-body rod protein FlgG [bacterium]HOL94024.1 flagellar basal-body rod protein FlgG [bacterium]HPO99996.1 flagellar basal-body rod protein FlgG [bacterium]